MDEEEQKRINMKNMIEEEMTPAPQNMQIDANTLVLSGIIENMNSKTEVVKQFLSDDMFKTEITSSQRKILPVMALYANMPYSSCIEFNFNKLMYMKNHNIKFDNIVITDEFIEIYIKKLIEELRIKVLSNFVLDFLKYGIAVNRNGRKEDIRAIGSLMQETIDTLKMMGNK